MYHMLGVRHWIPPKNSKMQEAANSLDWISTRQVTACEAPSSEPLSRLSVFERLFQCPVDECLSSYKRKDHLNRHMLQHKGKVFQCLVENCKSQFAYQGNMTRHMKEFHDESLSVKQKSKEHCCPEIGCGKRFKYPSKLRKHEESHVKLETVEALCAEPGCMKYFSSDNCLKEHVRSCHQHIICDKCGTKRLRKNIKRHLRTHEAKVTTDRIECSFEGCFLTFSTKSNMNQHIKSVHSEHKLFTCSFPQCEMKFSFKHVRDRHEKSGCHVFTVGDFEEANEILSMRLKGGRKRMYPVIETLTRKRVAPPSESDIYLNGIGE